MGWKKTNYPHVIRFAFLSNEQHNTKYGRSASGAEGPILIPSIYIYSHKQLRHILTGQPEYPACPWRRDRHRCRTARTCRSTPWRILAASMAGSSPTPPGAKARKVQVQIGQAEWCQNMFFITCLAYLHRRFRLTSTSTSTSISATNSTSTRSPRYISTYYHSY